MARLEEVVFEVRREVQVGSVMKYRDCEAFREENIKKMEDIGIAGLMCTIGAGCLADMFGYNIVEMAMNFYELGKLIF
ncbi:MAG: hypothetical protein WC548_03975 [Candidatus Pacearchaeota archaeon]